jgi:hypothetical protein
MIFTSAYSSFHNADGIMFYDYNDSSNWESDFVDGFFNIAGNHALMSLMPACAYAFRNNLISPAKETIQINYNQDTIYLLPKQNSNIFEGVFLIPKKLALIHSIRTGSFYSDSITDFLSLPAEPAPPYITDTGEITWNTNGILTVSTNRFLAVTGVLNNFNGTNIGSIQIAEASGFGTFTWLSLDNDSLGQTHHYLITLCSTIQNTGMIWDGTTTVHDKWGSAPTQIQPLKLKLKLNLAADSIKVYPLDVKGNNEPGKSKTYYPGTNNQFEIILDQNSENTLWFGIEQFGLKTSYKEESDSRLIDFNLMQNFPNPFNPTTTINYSIASTPLSLPGGGSELSGKEIKGEYNENITLKVYDILGREVAALVNEPQPAGTYRIRFDGSKLSSGIYTYILRAGNTIQSKKMILLK